MLEVRIKKRLENFSLDVDFTLEGGVLGLLGASGCGKSMTLRCIAGVETPDEGFIALNDVVFFDSEKHINLTPQQRKTALLPQNFQLFPNLTIEQNVAAGIDKQISAKEKREIVSSYLSKFDLQGFEKRYPATLSGGQQQRVALARMLAAKPGILMLDEPLSALDAHLKSLLEQDLRKLFHEQNVPIVYVSHDIDEAYRLTNKIAVMERGSIVELGASKDIVDNPTTYASMKLSGCKNIAYATYVDEHHVEVSAWGAKLTVEKLVPHDVCSIGIRAFLIEETESDEAENSIECCIEYISQTRFNVLVEARPLKASSADTRIYWRISTIEKNNAQYIPQSGDVVYLHLNPHHIYVARS